MQNSATTLHQDYTAAIVWADERKFTARAKHIDAMFHNTAEQNRKGEVTVQYAPSKEMAVNIMTNLLLGPERRRMKERISLVEM